MVNQSNIIIAYLYKASVCILYYLHPVFYTVTCINMVCKTFRLLQPLSQLHVCGVHIMKFPNKFSEDLEIIMWRSSSWFGIVRACANSGYQTTFPSSHVAWVRGYRNASNVVCACMELKLNGDLTWIEPGWFTSWLDLTSFLLPTRLKKH